MRGPKRMAGKYGRHGRTGLDAPMATRILSRDRDAAGVDRYAPGWTGVTFRKFGA